MFRRIAVAIVIAVLSCSGCPSASAAVFEGHGIARPGLPAAVAVHQAERAAVITALRKAGNGRHHYHIVSREVNEDYSVDVVLEVE